MLYNLIARISFGNVDTFHFLISLYIQFDLVTTLCSTSGWVKAPNLLVRVRKTSSFGFKH